MTTIPFPNYNGLEGVATTKEPLKPGEVRLGDHIRVHPTGDTVNIRASYTNETEMLEAMERVRWQRVITNLIVTTYILVVTLVLGTLFVLARTLHTVGEVETYEVEETLSALDYFRH